MKIIKNIKIEKIGYGGVGIAKLEDGKKVLIKGGALPGMTIDCKVVKNKKDYLQAHITKIHSYDNKQKPQEAFCPHFLSFGIEEKKATEKHKIGCGGCKRQIISYDKQLELKQDIVKDCFRKLENIPSLSPIIGSPEDKGYRNKIEFSFGVYISKQDEVDSRRNMGFHKQGEFSKIIDIDNCGLISQQANKIFEHIKKLCHESLLPTYDQKFHRGFFRHLVIREGVNTGQILVNLNICPINSPFSKGGKGVSIGTKSGLSTCNVIPAKMPVIPAKAGIHTKSKALSMDSASSAEGQIPSQDPILDQFQQRKKLKQTFLKDEFIQENITTFVITYNDGLADVIKGQNSHTEILFGDGHIFENLVFTEVSPSLDVIPAKAVIHTKNEAPTMNSNLHGNDNNSDKSILSTKETTLSFRVSPFSFFQTNTHGAEQLFQTAANMIGKIEGNILDLYCGTGSIGLSFLKLGIGNKLVGIEIVEEAIQDAKYNAKINGLEDKSSFYAMPSENISAIPPGKENIGVPLGQREPIISPREGGLGGLETNNFSLIIVDPPREGLHKKVVEFISELKKEQDFKLLYISCNPATMARDMQLFQENGFKIDKLQAVDMFPQTHHIETIGVLS